MNEVASICTLTVSANGDVKLCSGDKKVYTSKLLIDRRLRWVVERFDRLAKDHQAICQKEDLILLGDSLFCILFGQPLGDHEVFVPGVGRVKSEQLDEKTLGEVFLKIVDAHQTSGSSLTRLRLDLVFEEGTDEWASLPWEFLYAFRPDQQGFFVAGNVTHLSLTRFIKPPSARKEPPNPPHMLVILAQPCELGYHRTAEQFEVLKDKLRKSLRLPRESVEGVIGATWEQLTDRLNDRKKPVPDIIHFIGHGRFYDKRGQIALQRSKTEIDAERANNSGQAITSIIRPNEADWRNVEDLKGQLQGRAPWLFFLQTCNSNRANPEFGAFRSAAQQIAQADVPFVIAMQYEIDASDAETFADEFYKALGREISVDEAVMLGRDALGSRTPPYYGHPRFATPVIYLRSEHRVLVRSHVSDDSGNGAKSSWPQKCPECGKELWDKRKSCKCPRKIPLVYCTKGHVNVPGETECQLYDCDARIETEGSTPRAVLSSPSGRDVA